MKTETIDKVVDEHLGVNTFKRISFDFAIAMSTARSRKNMTLKQLSAKTGITVPRLSQIENADLNISLKTKARICEALEIKTAYT